MFNLGKRWKLILVIIYAIIFSLSGFAVAGPLHEAAKEGDLAKVKSLIAEGSDVNITDENGFTPLHFAAYRGYKDVAELLILKGANVNAADNNKSTYLHWAARKGDKDIAELLIFKGANVNAADKTGANPLHWAEGHEEVVELLIKHGGHK